LIEAHRRGKHRDPAQNPSDNPSLSTAVTSRYRALVEAGHLEADPAQLKACSALDSLADLLGQTRLARKSSALGWLFGQKAPSSPKGLYIWGAVGRGKTMLMDLFFETVQVKRKRRAHFHSFMADVHERIFEARQAAAAGQNGGDPIARVAQSLSDEAWPLCFDDVTVTDITDAMLLGRLFSALWSHGVVIVATSNVEPTQLYKDGLNRALFLPFIAMLQEKVEVMSLEARTDYRLEKLGGGTLYFSPLGADATAEMDSWWARLTANAPRRPLSVPIKGRQVDVPAAASGVARFDFADLCAKPLGASDYLAIARRFHTVLIDAVPAMTIERRNEAKRFITLIDVLYENHVKTIISAEESVDQLYSAERGFEAFEFARTVSRLIEMRSDEYLSHPHGSRDSRASGATTGLVET